MKQDKKLMLYMSILFLIVFVSFGVIVVNDKLSFYYIPKIDKKLNNYIEQNYSNIKNELKIGKTKYKNGKYYLKLTSKENKNLYFYIYYNNKKITDTYTTDYKEGYSLLKKIEKDLTKEISTTINQTISIKMTNTLANYSKQVQQKIIDEKNLINLKVYNISYETKINTFNTEQIQKEIEDFNTLLENNHITPKYINITITDKNDITNSIEIKNISSIFIKDSGLKSGINAIINNEKSDVLDKYNITYKYLN